MYYLLLAYDPEFGELFKVPRRLRGRSRAQRGAEALYARLIAIAGTAREATALDRSGVARVIEQTARWAGDAERLPPTWKRLERAAARSRLLGAQSQAVTVVCAADVQQAMDSQVRRARSHSRARSTRRSCAATCSSTPTRRGGRAGQRTVGERRPATMPSPFPTRITATTRLGDGEIIDIQREVELSGPIHSKGVMILAAFLPRAIPPTDRIRCRRAWCSSRPTVRWTATAPRWPNCARCCRRSASFPLKQSLAVTGSVNQHGQVQPIGAVNEKIEGFFDVCKARGLTGTKV